MAQQKPDRRVRRTKALLRQGLTTLLRDKALKDITVTELTALVDVNRGTFYCHYKDVYDMADQLETEMLQGFTQVINAYTTQTLRAGLYPILRDIFQFIGRNDDLCAAFLSGGDSAFFQRLKDVVYHKVSQEWGQLYGFSTIPGGDYFLSFLVAGVVGLVQTWGQKPHRESPDQMAALAEQLILKGIEPLKVGT